MRVGRLRHRIYLQSKVVTRDAFGSEVITYKTENPRPIFAGIEPLTAREYFASQQMKSQVTHKVILRYYPGVQTDWRVLYGTRQFNIIEIINPKNDHLYFVIFFWFYFVLTIKLPIDIYKYIITYIFNLYTFIGY